VIACLDTSAAAKAILAEPGSDIVDMVWDTADELVASRLLLVEMGSVIARVTRTLNLSRPAHQQITRAWEVRRRDIATVEVTASVVDRAVELVHRQPLSGADAVHLATALSLDLDGLVLVTWDARLHRAAVAEGLAVAPGDLSGSSP
jgi:hypothetical protein